MAADADRDLAAQSLVAWRETAHGEDGIAARDDDVRDELTKTLVSLRLAAHQKAGARDCSIQIWRFGDEAREGDVRRRDDQDTFNRHL
jgi:hypothetical protein